MEKSGSGCEELENYQCSTLPPFKYVYPKEIKMGIRDL